MNVVYNFAIPCFIFELSTVLYDRLMTSVCLQKVKKMCTRLIMFPKGD